MEQDFDLYGLLMADEPSAQQKAQAMAAALRRQSGDAQLGRSFGNLGLLTGDKVLGEFGQAQLQNANQAQDNVARKQGQLGQAGQFRLQKAIEAQRAKTQRAQQLADRSFSGREWDRRNAITSEQGLREAMIMAGMRASQAAKGTVVPGMEIVEGAAPTTDDAKKVKASLASAQRMKNYIDELKALHEAHGTEFGGEVGNRMQALTQQIRLEAKNIGELGALSGPDMGIVEQIAQADPGSFGANFKGLFGVDNTAGALGGLEHWVNDTLKGNMAAYGYREKALPGPASEEDEFSFLPPEDAKRARELQARANKGAAK